MGRLWLPPQNGGTGDVVMDDVSAVVIVGRTGP